ncbi:hypothetical protein ZWY2020_043865 [Hordeum vulgare]|nr:hypothetical protein ZWY2020_043865 [Hordeum vulgare]
MKAVARNAKPSALALTAIDHVPSGLSGMAARFLLAKNRLRRLVSRFLQAFPLRCFSNSGTYQGTVVTSVLERIILRRQGILKPTADLHVTAFELQGCKLVRASAHHTNIILSVFICFRTLYILFEVKLHLNFACLRFESNPQHIKYRRKINKEVST